MTELFDQLFAGDDEELTNYPGSRHPRREPVAPAPREVDADAWDARPYIKPFEGKDTEFFTLGALAAALGRELVTIRLWERKGYLPTALYRLPAKNGVAGRRLYTRPQIEAVLRIAREHGFLDSPRIDWNKHRSFSGEVAKAWRELASNA